MSKRIIIRLTVYDEDSGRIESEFTEEHSGSSSWEIERWFEKWARLTMIALGIEVEG